MSRTVYPRILAIEAQKPDGTRWRHDFKKRAAIVGNPDGSLSVRAKGAKLHKLFPYKGKQEPFLVNPPRRRLKKNPLIQLLNPPRRNATMNTRRMPAALKRYWDKKRRASKPRKNPWYERKVPMTVRSADGPAGSPLMKARRHRVAAALGIARRTGRKYIAEKFQTSRSAVKESVMSRKTKRRKLRANPPRRHHKTRRHYRRNPPFLPRMGEVGSVLKDGLAVTGGLLLPTLIVRAPAVARFTDTRMKRVAAKAVIGFAVSRLAKRFVGPRAAALMLVGTGAGLVLEFLPSIAPSLSLGLSDGYDPDQFPGMGEMPGLAGDTYGRPMMESFDEMPGL